MIAYLKMGSAPISESVSRFWSSSGSRHGASSKSSSGYGYRTCYTLWFGSISSSWDWTISKPMPMSSSKSEARSMYWSSSLKYV